MQFECLNDRSQSACCTIYLELQSCRTMLDPQFLTELSKMEAFSTEAERHIPLRTSVAPLVQIGTLSTSKIRGMTLPDVFSFSCAWTIDRGSKSHVQLGNREAMAVERNVFQCTTYPQFHYSVHFNASTFWYLADSSRTK